MKVAIVANLKKHSRAVALELKGKLKQVGIEINNKEPDVVITVGGDGTLLYAFHQYIHRLNEVRFVGVHTGHLGFYTDWRDYELSELVASLVEDHGESISYPLVDIEIEYYGGATRRHFVGLNETTIRRVNETMVADIYIGNELFESFRGDGLCIATPTGSTAYSKSMGGAVLHPQVNALQFTEIASINSNVYRTLGSPVVLAASEAITIELPASQNNIFTVDQITESLDNIKALHYRIADQKIRFASYRHTSFWHRVKNAFISDNSQEVE